VHRLLAILALTLATVTTAHAAPIVTPVTTAAVGPIMMATTAAHGRSSARVRLWRAEATLQLRAAGYTPQNGADLRSMVVLRKLPHRSYFEEHAARVDRDILYFLGPHTLEAQRARDQLLLPGPSTGGLGAAARGIAIFSSVVVSAAHAPEPLRVLFDRRFHLGPAIFDQGGMGAGIGGTL
jgi:hypothetical protein